MRRVPSEVIELVTREEIINFRDQSTNTIRDYASDIIETLKEKDVIISFVNKKSYIEIVEYETSSMFVKT